MGLSAAVTSFKALSPLTDAVGGGGDVVSFMSRKSRRASLAATRPRLAGTPRARRCSRAKSCAKERAARKPRADEGEGWGRGGAVTLAIPSPRAVRALSLPRPVPCRGGGAGRGGAAPNPVGHVAIKGARRHDGLSGAALAGRAGSTARRTRRRESPGPAQHCLAPPPRDDGSSRRAGTGRAGTRRDTPPSSSRPSSPSTRTCAGGHLPQPAPPGGPLTGGSLPSITKLGARFERGGGRGVQRPSRTPPSPCLALPSAAKGISRGR